MDTVGFPIIQSPVSQTHQIIFRLFRAYWFCLTFPRIQKWLFLNKPKIRTIHIQYIADIYDTIMHTAQNDNDKTSVRFAITKDTLIPFVSYTTKPYHNISKAIVDATSPLYKAFTSALVWLKWNIHICIYIYINIYVYIYIYIYIYICIYIP